MVLSSKNKKQWIRAMEDEIMSLKKNGTWKLCELPEDRKAVGCKWVYKAKKQMLRKTLFISKRV